MIFKDRVGYHKLSGNNREMAQYLWEKVTARDLWRLANNPAAMKVMIDKDQGGTFSAGVAISRWKELGSKIVYPDAEYNEFVMDTDSISKIQISDVKIVHPCFYICFPTDVKIKIGDSNEEVSGILVDDRHNSIDIFAFGQRDRAYTFHFTKGAEGFLKDIWRFDESVVGLTFEDVQTFLDVTFNYLLLMQEKPKYLKKDVVRHVGPKHRSTEYTFKISTLNLCQTVVETDKQKVRGEGKTPKLHWRRRHWRRQPHGKSWSGEGTIGTFEDGRQYHLIVVDRLLIGAK